MILIVLCYNDTMKKIIICVALIICLIAGGVVAFFVVRKNDEKIQSPTGTWWWNSKLDQETHLTFAADNGVNEIYFHTSKFDENTEAFITNANSKEIDVYWLAGEYQWLENNSKLLEKIDGYVEYQSQHKNAQFCGIHLDIEPHQSPDFKTNRQQLIYDLIDLASTLKINYPTIKFDYDLPFWFHDEITFNNQTKPAYEFMIDIANRVFVMSYRDTAEAILDIAKEEIAYAEQQNKQLVLCVETNSSEGDNVSFKEEGKQVMQEELDKLKKQIPENFGIAIHHIKTWYDLF